MITFKQTCFLISLLVVALGIWLFYRLKITYDESGRKEKMPPSFWLYVAWCGILLAFAAALFLG